MRTEFDCQKCNFGPFVLGKPAALEDRDNPDWAPCKNMGYSHALHLKKPAELDRHSKDNLEELACGDNGPEQGR